MDAVSYVLSRQRQGDSIALKRDVFGNYWAVVKHGWIFKTRRRVELDREQYFKLADAASRDAARKPS